VSSPNTVRPLNSVPGFKAAGMGISFWLSGNPSKVGGERQIMAFNGSGVHNRIHDWTTDLQNTVPVTASRMDAEHDDISTRLSMTICRDGQSTTTARIPFAQGTSAAGGSTSAVAYGQANDLNTGLYFPGTDQWGLAAGGTGVLTGTSSGV